MSNERRTLAVLDQIFDASKSLDDSSIVACALASSVMEMRALLNDMRDDHRSFIMALAALAAQNGGRLEIEKLTLTSLDPRDSIERSQDVETGNIVYTLVKASK